MNIRQPLRSTVLILSAAFFTVFLMPSLQLSHAQEPPALVPVVTLDKDGKPAQVLIPADSYRRRITKTLRALESHSLQALERAEKELHTNEAPSTSWKLKTVVIGVGASMEVGLGPIIELAAAPRIRWVLGTDASAPNP